MFSALLTQQASQSSADLKLARGYTELLLNKSQLIVQWQEMTIWTMKNNLDKSNHGTSDASDVFMPPHWQ